MYCKLLNFFHFLFLKGLTSLKFTWWASPTDTCVHILCHVSHALTSVLGEAEWLRGTLWVSPGAGKEGSPAWSPDTWTEKGLYLFYKVGFVIVFPPRHEDNHIYKYWNKIKPAGKRCQVELDYIMPLEAWSKVCLAFMLASQYFRRKSDMVNNTGVPRKFRRQTWRVPHFVFWWHIYTIPDQQIFVISRTKFLVENQTHNQKFQSTPCSRK